MGTTQQTLQRYSTYRLSVEVKKTIWAPCTRHILIEEYEWPYMHS